MTDHDYKFLIYATGIVMALGLIVFMSSDVRAALPL
jgi:hypothetical protein